jgi:hypothetical protein
MKDISQPKSDQLNADDLINTEMTILVTQVDLVGGDQPCVVRYENDNGRPYKPNKTFIKVMRILWGEDHTQYAGRLMTIFTADEVKWAGKAVGGLEIKAMSHIEKNATVNLTATRGKKRTIKIAKLEPIQQVPMYSIVQFNNDFPKMHEDISSGNLSADQVVAICNETGMLNDDQLNLIYSVKINC